MSNLQSTARQNFIWLFVYLFIWLFIVFVGFPSSAHAACNSKSEKYPLRPYPGEPCVKEVPAPNTVACANRPNPVGEHTYTVNCFGSSTCSFAVPPTTFVGRFTTTLNRFTEAPFTSFAEYDRPDYSETMRGNKLTYLADYLGGSGSVFYDTQPIKPGEPPKPTPQVLLDQSAIWQRLTPQGLQDKQKQSLQNRARSGQVHDYAALYRVFGPAVPAPRSTLNGTPVRITSLDPTSEFWKYAPAFSLEDSPGWVYLNFDQTTDRERIYIPHLPRIAESTLEIQKTLEPSQTTKITLPVPASDSSPTSQDPVLPNDEGENPNVPALAKDACDLTITGYSPADFLNTDRDPYVDVVTWTEPGKPAQTYSDGEQIQVVSRYPGTDQPEKSHYFLSRIPYIKPIWKGLYNASNAVFRTVLPKRQGSSTYWRGDNAESLDWPAEGTAPYAFTDTKAEAGAGKPGEKAKFYYRFLYILNRAVEDVIKSTNPYKLASRNLLPAPPIGRIPPGIPPTCSITGMPTTLASAINEASTRFNTPTCVLTAVAKIEGSHLFSASDAELASWLAPNGIDPNNCSDKPWGAAGPVQFTAGPWYTWPHADGVRGYGAALTTFDPSYAVTDPGHPGYASRCNLRAALWGASKKLSSDSVNPPGPYNGYLSGPVHGPGAWSEDEMRSAALHYYGSCADDEITHNSLGMSYCDFVVKECQTGNACVSPTPTP